MINKLFRNYCQSCEILVLSDSPNKKYDSLIYQNIFFFFFSSSVCKPSIFHPYFSLQTAQQYTERLYRMLHTPVTSLITSQATARPLWSIMLFGLWPLPSSLQLPSMCEEEKVLMFTQQRMFGL